MGVPVDLVKFVSCGMCVGVVFLSQTPVGGVVANVLFSLSVVSPVSFDLSVPGSTCFV